MLQSAPIAVLFPGEGSQVPGMRGLVADVRPDLLAAARALTDHDPFERVDESTRYAQPAIFCASLAGWARVRERIGTPIAFAGHSLGELTALAAAGVLDELDALRLVVLRGRLMAESGAASGGGTMLALLGATPDHAADLADRHRLAVANDNAPGQVVLSGARDDLRLARRSARDEGLRAIMLDALCALHSPQMAAAVEPFRRGLAAVPLRPPCAPVYSCASARRFEDPATELADALVTPVRWRSTMVALKSAGAGAYVDPGPGAVLAKLAPRCLPGARTTTLDDYFPLEHAA